MLKFHLSSTFCIDFGFQKSVLLNYYLNTEYFAAPLNFAPNANLSPASHPALASFREPEGSLLLDRGQSAQPGIHPVWGLQGHTVGMCKF